MKQFLFLIFIAVTLSLNSYSPILRFGYQSGLRFDKTCDIYTNDNQQIYADMINERYNFQIIQKYKQILKFEYNGYLYLINYYKWDSQVENLITLRNRNSLKVGIRINKLFSVDFKFGPNYQFYKGNSEVNLSNYYKFTLKLKNFNLNTKYSQNYDIYSDDMENVMYFKHKISSTCYFVFDFMPFVKHRINVSFNFINPVIDEVYSERISEWYFENLIFKDMKIDYQIIIDFNKVPLDYFIEKYSFDDEEL